MKYLFTLKEKVGSLLKVTSYKGFAAVFVDAPLIGSGTSNRPLESSKNFQCNLRRGK